MKKLKHLLPLLLAAACTACEDASEAFYTATYPVVRLEAEVRLATPEGADAPDDALRAEIEAAILTQAPVQAGGAYRTAFTRHDGGTLTVIPAPGGEPVAGTFDKAPGTREMRFAFGAHAYTVRMQQEHFTVDLTEELRARYPDAGITQAQRYEYLTAEESEQPAAL